MSKEGPKFKKQKFVILDDFNVFWAVSLWKSNNLAAMMDFEWVIVPRGGDLQITKQKKLSSLADAQLYSFTYLHKYASQSFRNDE